MTCPICNRDDNAYLNCNRPDCTDGRHAPSPNTDVIAQLKAELHAAKANAAEWERQAIYHNKQHGEVITALRRVEAERDNALNIMRSAYAAGYVQAECKLPPAAKELPFVEEARVRMQSLMRIMPLPSIMYYVDGSIGLSYFTRSPEKGDVIKEVWYRRDDPQLTAVVASARSMIVACIMDNRDLANRVIVEMRDAIKDWDVMETLL